MALLATKALGQRRLLSHGCKHKEAQVLYP